MGTNQSRTDPKQRGDERKPSDKSSDNPLKNEKAKNKLSGRSKPKKDDNFKKRGNSEPPLKKGYLNRNNESTNPKSHENESKANSTKKRREMIAKEENAQRVTKRQLRRLASALQRTSWYLGRRIGMDDSQASRYQTSFATEEERKFQILLWWRRNNGSKATSQRLVIILQHANYTQEEYQVMMLSSNGDVRGKAPAPDDNRDRQLHRSDVTKSYDNVSYGNTVEARILEKKKGKSKSRESVMLPPWWDQSLENIHKTVRKRKTQAGEGGKYSNRRKTKSLQNVTMPDGNTAQTDDSGHMTLQSEVPARNLKAQNFTTDRSDVATRQNAVMSKNDNALKSPMRKNSKAPNSNYVELRYGSLPSSSRRNKHKKEKKPSLSRSVDNVCDVTALHDTDVRKSSSVQAAIDNYETLTRLNAGKKRESMAESIARYNQWTIDRRVTSRSSMLTSEHVNPRHSRIMGRSHHFTFGGKGTFQGMFKGLISGLALLRDGSFVASDGDNKRIQIFDKSGAFVTSFHSNTELKPKGVCVTMGEKIAVCCGDSVNVFDKEGNLHLSFGRGVFRNNSYSVCCDRENNYYVTDIVTHSISIHDARGNIRKKFGFEGSSMIHFNQPVSLAINSKNKLFVSDSQNHCVKVYKLSGRPLFRIGAQGSADGLFWNPLGICVDSEDNLVVADCGNNRISQFNSEGQFLRHLLTEEDGLFMPSLVQVNDRGQVIVCEWEKQLVKVFTVETAI